MRHNHRAHKKYSQKAPTTTTSTSIQISEDLDVIYSEYTGDLTIGTPPQTVTMLFDTGSSDFWIYNSKCSTLNCTDFDSSKSSTFVDNKQSVNLNYIQGFSTGILSSDVVGIGTAQIPRQNMVLVPKINSDTLIKSDGIIGFAWQDLSVTKTNPFMYNLVGLGLVSDPMFSFYLGNDVSSPEAHLGGFDTSKFSGAISWLPVSKKYYWQVLIDSVTIGNQLVSSTNEQAVFDTGTSLILAPLIDMPKLASALKGTVESTRYGYGKILLAPCDQTGMPNIDIKMSGKIFSLSPKDYMTGFKYGNFCFTWFQALDDSTNKNWILGSPFLKKFYSIYSMGNSTVGLALAK